MVHVERLYSSSVHMSSLLTGRSSSKPLNLWRVFNQNALNLDLKTMIKRRHRGTGMRRATPHVSAAIYTLCNGDFLSTSHVTNCTTAIVIGLYIRVNIKADKSLWSQTRHQVDNDELSERLRHFVAVTRVKLSLIDVDYTVKLVSYRSKNPVTWSYEWVLKLSQTCSLPFSIYLPKNCQYNIIQIATFFSWQNQ